MHRRRLFCLFAVTLSGLLTAGDGTRGDTRPQQGQQVPTSDSSPRPQRIEADHLPHTQPPAGSFHRGMPDTGAELADRLLDVIALHDASTIAAVIVEPFAGSAGVLIPPQVRSNHE